jgi:NAD(P)H-flavin reductase
VSTRPATQDGDLLDREAVMVPRPFVVDQNRRDTRDTVTLDLVAADDQPLVFAPGQFTMLSAFGAGEVPISISGDPAHPEVLQHTIRNVGGVTRNLAHASPGTALGIRGPFGHGWDVADGRGGDVVFVAGGIGLAPLRPAILEVCADRPSYGQVRLLYGSRTPEDILFGADLHTWARDHDVVVEEIVDAGTLGWHGHVGLVTQLVARGGFDPARTLALVCGPEVMMRYAAQALYDRGVGAPHIRLSMERNMKCGVGLCGHCQLRELFLCVDGPVLSYDRLEPLLTRAEL